MRALLLLFLALPFSCVAATLTCTGTVEKLGLHAPDKIMLKLSSMNTAVFICDPSANWSVSGTSYTTSAETCKTMLSMLMHAKSMGSEMGSVWFDGDDVPSNCTEWESWQEANVRAFLY